MKELITLILFFSFTSSKANDIDKIKSAEDVSRFLRDNFKYKKIDLTDTAWVYNEDKKLIKLADSLNVKYWFTEDLDNNKETDLFAFGYAETKGNKDGFLEMIVILSENGKFKKINLKEYYVRTFGGPEVFPSLKRVGNLPIIVVYTYTEPESVFNSRKIEQNDNSSLQVDTLTFKYGLPILYSESSYRPLISRIEFKTSQCFGTCPVFEMTITEDRNIVYNAVKFNKQQGIFSCTLSEIDYDYIINCLISSKFEALNDKYAVNWTDDQTVTIKIQYDIDKVKQISDYGKVSNIGLMFLYRKLFSLRSLVQNCR